MENKIVIEKAKNGNYTCKYTVGNGYKYIYSKYKPEKIMFNVQVKENVDYIVLVGLGLAYELALLRKKTDKLIYVIEFSEQFYNFYNNYCMFENVKILYKDEFKQIKFNDNIQVILNEKIIESDLDKYREVLHFFNPKKQLNRTVLFYYHPTIALDCMMALENLGYKTIRKDLTNTINIAKEIISIKPKYVFTVNFYTQIADICEKLGITYISWVVDTPCYTLYEKELNYNYSSIFIYDESIVIDLLRKGAKNIYYLPVAANIERLNNVQLSKEDLLNYTCEVSFLGSCCSHNEYLNRIKPSLDNETINLVDSIINLQMESDEFVIKQHVNEALINLVTLRGKITLTSRRFLNFNDSDILSMYLGRYHSHIERKTIMNYLAQKNNLFLYGENGWLREDSGILSKVYKGHAEHYLEMPKVFKASKINLNITRSFVESGLPMRVFDVLGSQGFLVTNNKEDISRLFIPNKELVVYRDLKDLEEIIEYYLVHEDEREVIKYQGFERVKQDHTFEIRIKEIMNKVNKNIEMLK